MNSAFIPQWGWVHIHEWMVKVEIESPYLARRRTSPPLENILNIGRSAGDEDGKHRTVIVALFLLSVHHLPIFYICLFDTGEIDSSRVSSTRRFRQNHRTIRPLHLSLRSCRFAYSIMASGPNTCWYLHRIMQQWSLLVRFRIRAATPEEGEKKKEKGTWAGH